MEFQARYALVLAHTSTYAHCPAAAPPASFLNTACSLTPLLFPLEGPAPRFLHGEFPNLTDTYKVTPGNPFLIYFASSPYFMSFLW